MSSIWRRLIRRFRAPQIPFVYSPRYGVDFPTPAIDSQRGQRILALLDREGLIHRGNVHRPRRARLSRLALAHTPQYLDQLQHPGATEAILGIRLDDQLQDAFLELQRAMVGGTLLATRLAKRHGLAFHLGGGLHHAEAGRGQGFCAFNDVAIAIRQSRRRGFPGRVAVVDLDLHDGEGTRKIFKDDSTVHTYSLHNQTLDQDPAVESTEIELGAKMSGQHYLEKLRESLPGILERFQPETVYYLAGTDVAATDELGDAGLTDLEILERDQCVLNVCNRIGVKRTVILLAGGYGSQAWRYSARLAAWLHAPKLALPPRRLSLTALELRRARRLYDRSPLPTASAKGPFDWNITAEEVGLEPNRHTRFLDHFSRHGLEILLERFGILDRLEQKGFTHVRVHWDLDANGGDTLWLRDRSSEPIPLVELRVSRNRQLLPGCHLLWINWLRLQDPSREFPEDRPRLPGQLHPGLGVMKPLLALFVEIAKSMKLDGLAYTPERYHIARMSPQDFVWANEAADDRYRKTQQQLHDLPMHEATQKLESEGETQPAPDDVWPPGALVRPLTSRARAALGPLWPPRDESA